ncbi:helix-turn-helix transcriptional regulator [Planosporangium thailandense]|uniref:Helix-turn-helix transcriptional regulator n=1 Tax=Planosporangium thailandense TaxID=765197 RepID=A0ABX0Y3M1_9ACTN|nr:TetR/AcrR family transcriptional regulator [Planosporangium thailandense]NJC71929.1 helix-turn-helix transcriptional regulator [Planosporangium thailandense]
MSGRVQVIPTGRQRYHSALRQAQARATRAAVLDAATRLFAIEGFVRTTMQAIATEAGVAVETVYAQGSKTALLLTCVDRTLTGDDDDLPLIERTPFVNALTAGSQTEIVEAFVRLLIEIAERAGGLLVAFEHAAAADAKIAALWEQAEQRRRQDYRRLVEALATAGPLGQGWGVETATDALWATVNPRLAHVMLHQLTWTPDRLLNWIVGAVAAILPSTTDRSSR